MPSAVPVLEKMSDLPNPELPPLRRQVLGRGTRESVLRHARCAGMMEAGMLECAHVAAGAYYVIARGECPIPLVIVCSGGAGRVMVGGQRHELRAGEALLVPPGPAHELRAEVEGWVFAIFMYLPARLGVAEVARVRLHSRPLISLVDALMAESAADSDPLVQRRLMELIDLKVRQLANPVARADQLGAVWAEVARRPAQPWNIANLAALASVSGEHLRRITQRETARAPMEQVAWIRLQRAAVLLTTTNEVVEEIAAQVGYASVRAFRAAFAKAHGSSPKDHRAHALRNFSARADRAGGLAPHIAPIVRRGQEGRYAGVAAVRRWRHLPFAPVANTRYATGPAPWFGMPLLHVRPGVKRIHGVPFALSSEGCVVLRSDRHGTDAKGRELPALVAWRTSGRVARAYVLHAAGWASRSGAFARYRWRYADGQVEETPVHSLGIAHPEEPEGRPANIQDWYFSYDHIAWPQARPYDLKPRADPTATSQYLYTLEWRNPRPEAAVVALEAEAVPGCDATLAILAVTTAQT
jgi:AraC-like DNA-binding protein